MNVVGGSGWYLRSSSFQGMPRFAPSALAGPLTLLNPPSFPSWLHRLPLVISGAETAALLLAPREQRVWVRPSRAGNLALSGLNFDVAANAALNTPRAELCGVLRRSSNFTLCTMARLARSKYFADLKRFRFVASPAGNGTYVGLVWSVGRSIDWSVGRLVGWSVGRLVGWLVGCLVGWLVGCLVVSLVG